MILCLILEINQPREDTAVYNQTKSQNVFCHKYRLKNVCPYKSRLKSSTDLGKRMVVTLVSRLDLCSQKVSVECAVHLTTLARASVNRVA